MSSHSECLEGAGVPYQEGAIFKFPVELLLMCVDYMDRISISRFSRTCKGFTVALRDILEEKAQEFAWSSTDPEGEKEMKKKSLYYDAPKPFVLFTSPMHKAIREGRIDALRGFLEAGMSPNLINPNRMPILSVAIYDDQIDAAKLLLEYGADPCAGSAQERTTPLHQAAQNSGPRNCMVGQLLRAGAKVEDINTFQALFKHENAVQNIEQALMNGSDFSLISQLDEPSMLFTFSSFKVNLFNVRVVDIILDKWPSFLSLKYECGNTPLKHNLRHPVYPRNAIYFLDRGSDLCGGELQDAIAIPRGCDFDGWETNPARTREIDSIRRTIIEKLFAHPQLDINTVSMSHWGAVEKPLITAFWRPDIETARMILEHPAFHPDAEDICVMTDKLTRERQDGPFYESRIQGEREILKMTARRLAMNF